MKNTTKPRYQPVTALLTLVLLLWLSVACTSDVQASATRIETPVRQGCVLDHASACLNEYESEFMLPDKTKPFENPLLTAALQIIRKFQTVNCLKPLHSRFDPYSNQINTSLFAQKTAFIFYDS